MARVRISEFAAKKLILGENYSGISCHKENYLQKIDSLPLGIYVVKVDSGIKKRGLNNLIKIKIEKNELGKVAEKFFSDSYEQILIEPFIPHDLELEQYLSISLVKKGYELLFSKRGGIEVENATEIKKHIFPVDVVKFTEKLNEVDFLNKDIKKFAENLVQSMSKWHLSFVEINPFINLNNQIISLDMAVEVDNNFVNRLPDWVSEHVIFDKVDSRAEAAVKEISVNSQATFSLTVFSENAPIFTLLSGGGASLVVLDVLVDQGLQAQIANYGEYSGGPNQLETSLYTNEILKLLFASTAKRKVLVIAGGVANFTDILVTFSGIVDAIEKNLESFSKQQILIIVRRGGPRQSEGIAYLKKFLNKNNIKNIVAGPEKLLSDIAYDVKDFLYDSKN